MPVKVAKRGEKYRVVESDGEVATNNSGTPVDGGGHESRQQAVQQAQAINARTRREDRSNGK